MPLPVFSETALTVDLDASSPIPKPVSKRKHFFSQVMFRFRKYDVIVAIRGCFKNVKSFISVYKKAIFMTVCCFQSSSTSTSAIASSSIDDLFSSISSTHKRTDQLPSQAPPRKWVKAAPMPAAHVRIAEPKKVRFR